LAANSSCEPPVRYVMALGKSGNNARRPHAFAFALGDRVAQIVATLLSQSQQPPDDLFVLRQDVILLADVVNQVVKLRGADRPWLILGRHAALTGRIVAQRAISMRQHQLPWAAPHGFQLRSGPLTEWYTVEKVGLMWIFRSRLAA